MQFKVFVANKAYAMNNIKKISCDKLILLIFKDFDTSPKRAGNVGLFPFPRVGRSDPEMSEWESNSFENYDGKICSV